MRTVKIERAINYGAASTGSGPMSGSTTFKWAVAVLLSTSVLPIAQVTLLAPALSSIQVAYQQVAGASFLIRLMLVAPTVGIVVVAPLAGALADVMSKSRLLSMSLGAFGACSILAYFSGNLSLLIAVRLAMGVCLAAIMTTTTALISEYAAGAERETALGWQSAAISFTGAIAPLVGGAVATLDWRLVFLIYATAALLAFPASKLQSKSRSAATSAMAFRYRDVIDIYIVTLVGMLLLYLTTIQISYHMKVIGEGAPIWAGLAMASPAVMSGLCAMRYGWVRSRMAFLNIAGAAFALMAAGYGLVGVGNKFVLLVGLALAGCGFGILVPNGPAWLLSRVPASARGRALGGLSMAGYLGVLISPFVYGPVVAVAGSSGTFQWAALSSAAIAAVLLASCIALRPTYEPK